jgi:hypothetical protein
MRRAEGQPKKTISFKRQIKQEALLLIWKREEERPRHKILVTVQVE